MRETPKRPKGGRKKKVSKEERRRKKKKEEKRRKKKKKEKEEKRRTSFEARLQYSKKTSGVLPSHFFDLGVIEISFVKFERGERAWWGVKNK